MASWRLRQIATRPGFIIDQDRRLIEFVQARSIDSLRIDGDDDIDYFQTLLPNCTVGRVDHKGMLAMIANSLGNRLEDILAHVTKQIGESRPKFVYIAVNKYLLTTDITWDDLTDDLDVDILGILQKHMRDIGYKELARFFVTEDYGKHYNFAHPTTNAYYERAH